MNDPCKFRVTTMIRLIRDSVDVANEPRFVIAAVAPILGLLLTLGMPSTVQASFIASTTDLWDVSQGATVTSHSGVIFGSDIRNMFGFVSGFPTDPTVNTLFRDAQPTGTLHAVEWQTSAAVTLRSFTLFAAHDGLPRNATARGFSRFTLYAFDPLTSSFNIELFELFPSNPYGNTPAPEFSVIETNAAGNLLVLGANIAPVTAQRFRAEFVQFGFFAPNASGPRVFELDGFDAFHEDVATSTPEPASCVLFGVGFLAISARGRLLRRTRAVAQGSGSL
jgi:hypothetical protein